MTVLGRRDVLAGVVALALPRRGAAGAFAPPAVTLARPAVPPRAATGLAVSDGEGAARHLAELAGRIVVLNLWGPWCLPCRREMPSLARLAAAVDPARVAVWPLAFDWRGAAGVRRFFTETGISNLPVLIGDGANLKATLAIEALPTTAILDRGGRMIFEIAGEARWDDAATLDWLSGLA